MNWQDELRQLDGELAAGRLSSDDYRIRRDAITSRAATGASAAPAQPDQPAPDPFPSAFAWQNQAPSTADATSIMKPVAAPTPPPEDRTQAVMRDDQPERTQIVRNINQGERTQIVSDGGARPPMGYPQQQMNANTDPWNQGGMQSVPPWGGMDNDAPLQDLGNANWMHQGAEVFETSGNGKRGKRTLGIAIVAVLIVGLAVAAVFYFGSKNADPQPGGGGGGENPTTTKQVPTTSKAALPEPPAPKPDQGDARASLVTPLPGTVRPGGGRFTLEKVQSEKPLGPETITALQAGELTEGWLSTTNDGADIISLAAFKVKDADAAKAVVEAYAKDQSTLDEDRGLEYQGVKVFDDGSSTVYRAAYVLYDRAVFVEVYTRSGAPDAVRAQFIDLLKKQLEFAPPTEK